jgi:hypothetical protein
VKWQSLKAGPGGGFTSQVTLPLAGCADIDVRAVGGLGSTASYTIAMPTCRKP